MSWHCRHRPTWPICFYKGSVMTISYHLYGRFNVWNTFVDNNVPYFFIILPEDRFLHFIAFLINTYYIVTLIFLLFSYYCQPLVYILADIKKHDWFIKIKKITCEAYAAFNYLWTCELEKIWGRKKMNTPVTNWKY